MFTDRRYFNYKVLLLSSSILAFANGLFSPFYIIFLQKFGGGYEQFGIAVGLMVLASSITAFYVGRFSDQLGRKIFLLIGGIALAIIVFLYTLVNSMIMLYVLQILSGVATTLQLTMETAFLGDVTRKISRGTDIGKYQAITGVIAAFAVMIGGFVVQQMGFKIIFYITSIFILISTLFLFKIKE